MEASSRSRSSARRRAINRTPRSASRSASRNCRPKSAVVGWNWWVAAHRGRDRTPRRARGPKGRHPSAQPNGLGAISANPRGLKGRDNPIANVVEMVKTSSSKWIKTKAAEFAEFHWQSGYGAFSVSQSDAGTRRGIYSQSDAASPEDDVSGGVAAVVGTVIRSRLMRNMYGIDRYRAPLVRRNVLVAGYPGRCPGLTDHAPLALQCSALGLVIPQWSSG